MSTPIVGAGLISGLSRALAANAFTIWRDKRGGRRAFRDHIRSILAELQAVDLKNLREGQLFLRYQDTIQSIRAERAKAYEDIRASNRLLFEKAWLGYCGLEQQHVEPYDEFDPVTSPTAINFPNYERGLQTMAAPLIKMMEYAR